MLFTAIDHPAIACHDVAKQMDWYCAHLGMKIIATDGKTPAGAALVGYDFASGQGAVELMSARDAGPNSDTYQRFQPGIRHLAFRVSDFEKAYSELKLAGIQFMTEPAHAMGGGRIVSFRDPEGNELQIVQR